MKWSLEEENILKENYKIKNKSELLDLIYPVGSIYISVNSTSPATLFGGTWEILNDVFLLAAGSYANAGTFGGEATHTLTVDEMPSHSHTYTIPGNETGTSWYGAKGTAKGTPQSSGDSGGSWGGGSSGGGGASGTW